MIGRFSDSSSDVGSVGGRENDEASQERSPADITRAGWAQVERYTEKDKSVRDWEERVESLYGNHR